MIWLKKNKRLLLLNGIIVLSFLVLIACIEIFSDYIDYPHRPQLILELESLPQNNEYIVYYDIGYGFRLQDSIMTNVKATNTTLKIRFNLPTQKSIKGFRVDTYKPINATGNILIRSIKLITEKKTYYWSPREIALQFIPLKDIDKFEEKDGHLLIHCSGNTPQFALWFSTIQDFQLPNITKDIQARFNEVDTNETGVVIKGWAFLKGQSTDNSTIYLVLHSDQKTYTFNTLPQIRPDITMFFHNGFNLNNSGFIAHIRKSDIVPDRYQVGIYIVSKTRTALINTNSILDIK